MPSGLLKEPLLTLWTSPLWRGQEMELAININSGAGEPLHHQLYQELRRSILSRRLSAGQRIPYEGHLERHLRRMRTLYDRRRQKLVTALHAQFGARVSIMGENSGMHLMIQLRSPWSNEEVIRRAAAAGVGLLNARMYYVGPGGRGEFVLGDAMFKGGGIQEGVGGVAKAA